jgi:hypothetical protein
MDQKKQHAIEASVKLKGIESADFSSITVLIATRGLAFNIITNATPKSPTIVAAVCSGRRIARAAIDKQHCRH